MRLALYQEPGFLILDGPEGSLKTDLLTLIGNTTKKHLTIDDMKTQDNLKLSEQIYKTRYLTIDLGPTDTYPSSLLFSLVLSLMQFVLMEQIKTRIS